MRPMKRALYLILAALLLAALLIPAARAVQTETFSDVDPAAWYAWCVNDARQRDLLKGTGNNRFSPDGTLTRAMMVTILWRMAGQPMYKTPIPYSDVNQVQWYSYAVGWANEHRVTNGVGNNLFGPDEPVTREQMAVLFYRWAKAQGYDVSFTHNEALVKEEAEVSYFRQDSENGYQGYYVNAGKAIHDWAVDAVEWAAERDFLTLREVRGVALWGSAWYLCAPDDATRAETAVFLSRFCRAYLDGGKEVTVSYLWDILTLDLPETWQGAFRASTAGYDGVPDGRSVSLWDLSNVAPRSGSGRLFTLTLWPVGVDSSNFGSWETFGDAAHGKSGLLCTVEVPGQGKLSLYIDYPSAEDGALYDPESPGNYKKMSDQIDGILRSIRFREDVKILSLAPFFSVPLETKTTLPDWPNGSPEAMDLETVN